MNEDTEFLLKISTESREKVRKELVAALQNIKDATADYGNKPEDLRWQKTNHAYLNSLCSNTEQATKLRNDIKEYNDAIMNKEGTFMGAIKSLFYRLFDGGVERKKIALSYFELSEKIRALNINMNKSNLALQGSCVFIPRINTKSIEALLTALREFFVTFKKLNKDIGLQRRFSSAYGKLKLVFDTYYKNKPSVEVSPQLTKNGENLDNLEKNLETIIQAEVEKALSASQNPAKDPEVAAQQSQIESPFFLEAQRGKEAGVGEEGAHSVSRSVQ